jgi:hypothetical protein
MPLTGPALPLDIIESIIDQLYDDRVALCACSLTRRAWLHRSRVHLHRRITLYHENFNFRNNREALHFETLRNELPAILPYVTDLFLAPAALHPADKTCTTQIWGILGLLSHIRMLYIRQIDCSSTSPLYFDIARKHRWDELFPCVMELCVSASSFTNGEDFLRFAHNFPQLRTLTAQWIKTVNEPSTTQTSSSLLAPLTLTPRTIELLCSYKAPGLTAALAGYLEQSVEAREQLGRLRIDSTLTADQQLGLAQLTKIVGSTLSDLQVHLQEQCDAHDKRSNLRPQIVKTG